MLSRIDLLAITHRNGIRIAEVGFALIAIGGALLALMPATRHARTGTILAGVALAAGGVLMIVAVHWAGFN